MARIANYRTINICPDANELLKNQKPLLRENKVIGAYDGIDQYLDTQFRLLREDFIRPLRELIAKYNFIKSKRTSTNKVENVYRKVQVFGARFQGEEIIHSCQFDSTPFKNSYWKVSTCKILITLLS